MMTEMIRDRSRFTSVEHPVLFAISCVLMLYVSLRYLDYGDAEWKRQANEALKPLET